MADKRKARKRKEEFGEKGEEADKPTKQEYAVAKWLKSNLPTKKTKFLNHPVEYFTGSKAVDALLTSKWATGDSPLFTSRKDISDFLNDMLVHKFFHRAKKVPVSELELKGRSKKVKDSEKSSKSGDETAKEKEGDKSSAEGKAQESKEAKEKEKRKRKIRLEMHLDQYFVDGSEAYVWIYDPIPLWYWLAGLALLLGAIGICMFPLWPPTVRKGVYYLSIAAAGFLVFIIVLAILRLVIFCIVWAVTLSRHNVWILPNLTEDVGFFESFWPLYHYEYKGPGSESSSGKEGKKKKRKEKLSDDEQPDEKKTLLKKKQEDCQSSPSTREEKGKESAADEKQTESESENSQLSSTGRDFEIVDPQEVDTS